MLTQEQAKAVLDARRAEDHKVGRPTLYNSELGKIICDKIANGMSFKQFDADPDMPRGSTIIDWYFDNAGGEFGEWYEKAQRTRLFAMAHETLDISDASQGDVTCDEYGNPRCDHEYVARSRLRVDTRKWLAAKLLHNMFGDRVEVDNKGNSCTPIINIGIKNKDDKS
jgi:hypothetical protein